MKRNGFLALTTAASLSSVVLCASCRATSDDRPKPPVGSAAATPVIELDDEPAAEEVEVLELDDEPAEVQSPSALPSGFFSDIASLCVAQEMRVAEPMAKAMRESQDFEALLLKPSCMEDTRPLSGVRIALAAPFMALTTVVYETAENSTHTALVVRTAKGWVAMTTPVMVSEHDDPGCPSILRDGPLSEVRVRAAADGSPVMFVRTTAGRGGGDMPVEVIHRLRTCRLGDESIGCSADKVTLSDRDWPPSPASACGAPPSRGSRTTAIC